MIMERVEVQENNNEDIDEFYVVDAWCEKQSPDIDDNSTGGRNIDVSAKEGSISRRKPTEGEIDEFLKNLKELNSNCGTSGLKGDSSLKSSNPSINVIEIEEESSKDRSCPLLGQGKVCSSDKPLTIICSDSVQRSAVSYKPGGTLTKTIFPESTIKANDLSNSLFNCQKISISSSEPLIHVSLNRNEDSGGGFSDKKDSSLISESSHHSTCRNKPSAQRRRVRSRSPQKSSPDFSSYLHTDRITKSYQVERDRNQALMDNIKADMKKRDRRNMHRTKGHKSRSISKERHRTRSPSPRRLYRSHKNHSPTPPKRKTGNEDRMNPSCPPFYQNPGFREGFSQDSLPQNPPYMNSTLSMPPVQYPTNSAPSGNSFGRFPEYESRPNMFGQGPPELGFQQQMGQTFAVTQYPQNYHGYNPGIPTGLGENPPNPVPFPSAWNPPNHGFNQSQPNIPAGAVMYPHLKIGQPRADIYNRSKESSLDSSPRPIEGRNSSEKRKYSISPDSRKQRRKSSKRHSKSPAKKYDERDMRHERRSSPSPVPNRFESKKPKMIIDPNRIPTPPPPPIVGSYHNDDKKSNDKPKNTATRSTDNNPLTGFLNKERVSLSCLLEAVMENSGQGKSQLSNPKVKKEIISKCESKIQRLYKRRMTGLGAFIPEPVQSSLEIEHASPLIAVYSHFTYNCDEEISEWHCPGIIKPQVKIREKQKCLEIARDSKPPQQYSEDNKKIAAEVIPTLANSQPLTYPNCERSIPQILPQPSSLPCSYSINQQSSCPSYQSSHHWANPVQNPFPAQPPIPGIPSEMQTLGVSRPPLMYPFQRIPVNDYIPPQQGYPPQPAMINYPSRNLYPPMQHFPSRNINPPAMYNNPQSNSLMNNFYPHTTDKGHESKKNKNNINNNLIVLNNSGSQTGTKKKKEEMTAHIDLTREDEIIDAKVPKEASPNAKVPKEASPNAKDKFMRKIWQLRKSSDYINAPVEEHSSKDLENEFYSKLNYADMQEDTQLDTIHDYQLINLRERIENCLAEGKGSPECHRSRERREGDRGRLRGRDRERDRTREKNRARRGLSESDQRRHGRSPDDVRKRRRSGELFDREMRSRESSTLKDSNSKSKRGDVEIISDEEQSKQKSNESSLNEAVKNENDESCEKTLSSQILKLLGPEIRKVQEKSDLYKSIIDSLEKGDRAYKRLYSFKNTALTKLERDDKKLVIPRDYLKEVITSIHKNFHHVQIEELIRYLKDMIFPCVLHLPKCVNKVVSECPTCIELKKNEEKKEDTLTDKKTDAIERKQEKRTDKSIRERDKDKRNPGDRDRRKSRDRSLSSKSRRDLGRSVKEREKDGRPSGYEKATKVRKPAPATSSKSSNELYNSLPSEDSSVKQLSEVSEVSHDLSNKALEFKHTDSSVLETKKCSIEFESDNPQVSVDISSKDEVEARSADQVAMPDDPNECNLENKNPEEIELSSCVEGKDQVNIDEVSAVSEVTNSSISKSVENNPNPSDIAPETVSEENTKINVASEEVDDTNKNEEKIETKPSITDIRKKDDSKLDFKGRVRLVQMRSKECKDIISALESANDNGSADSSYLMKGGMLCKKLVVGSNSEVKIMAPHDELEEVVNIVHTMSAIHTPASKVVNFFSKHFTLVENLESKVNEFVNKCSHCMMKRN